MALTHAQMVTRAMRDAQIPEDSSTAGVQAQTDAGQYINECARDVWKRRLWEEYLILGTFTVPASTSRIALSDIVVSSGYSTSANGYKNTFHEIIAVREGSNPLMPEDAGAIQKLQADLWVATTSPVLFVNRGQNGITLLGQYSTATALGFFGKGDFQDLTTGETWVLANENCLIAGAAAKLIEYHERNPGRAQLMYQAYEAEIAKMILQREEQGANIKRVVPLNPWTKDLSQGIYDTTHIGIQTILG